MSSRHTLEGELSSEVRCREHCRLIGNHQMQCGKQKLTLLRMAQVIMSVGRQNADDKPTNADSLRLRVRIGRFMR